MTPDKKGIKPLGRKAYGSIGHLPNSRLGKADHCVPDSCARICTEHLRDKHDRIIVQEKLDGSCVAVALLGGKLFPLGRAGWPAESSPHEQHKLFAQWVGMNEERFRSVLTEGERLVGEWLAQAHGTIYDLSGREPFGAFDLMVEERRVCFDEFNCRVTPFFWTPTTLHDGGPISTEEAMSLCRDRHWPCDEVEGVVYRVHRKGRVLFLAKWVRLDKIDGKYLPEVSGRPAVWNWKP
jgi:hypothetical protein